MVAMWWVQKYVGVASCAMLDVVYRGNSVSNLWEQRAIHLKARAMKSVPKKSASKSTLSWAMRLVEGATDCYRMGRVGMPAVKQAGGLRGRVTVAGRQPHATRRVTLPGTCSKCPIIHYQLVFTGAKL